MVLDYTRRALGTKLSGQARPRAIANKMAKTIKIKKEKEEKDGEKTPQKEEKGSEIKDEPRPEYEELVQRISVIAKPLAGRKLTKRLYKTVKKASKSKTLRRGVKEVVKALRKGEKGIAVIAGDISPIDVISHVPVLCEDSKVPYVYVPSKLDLGAAGQTKRPTSIVLVKPHEDIKESYDECFSEVKGMPLPI